MEIQAKYTFQDGKDDRLIEAFLRGEYADIPEPFRTFLEDIHTQLEMALGEADSIERGELKSVIVLDPPKGIGDLIQALVTKQVTE